MLSFVAAVCAQAVTVPPSGPDVAALSNVAWPDPVWANDGSGAMPIGNGDATASVELCVLYLIITCINL